tara:strand:+ start:3261 stop:3992 length:732 start_codon:yes stop_codon:yes gene_type:complete
MKKVLISGGSGKLAREIIKQSKEYRVILPHKEEMDVRNLKDVLRCIDSYKPDYFIHAAAYTRPMSKHQENPHISLQTNIVGTSNVTLACMKYNTKLIYISTDYVYPGIDGNYHEDDPLSPFQVESDGNTKYGWSKLGGECAVRMYDNSLILRLCMCDYPFPHNVALVDVKKNLMYNFQAANVILKLLDHKGVINVGGKAQSVYDFVSKKNPYIKKGSKLDVKDVIIAPDTTMNISRLKEALND